MNPRQNTRGEDSYIIHDILPAFADYGYPRTGDTKNLKIKGDVKIRMGSSLKEPDVVFYAEGVPVLLVESKKPGKSKQDAEEQAQSYIRNFPIEKYSKDGRPPQYAAVTIGRVIHFYRYKAEVNPHGAIIDRLEPMSEVLSYEELKRLYGLKESAKPAIGAEEFSAVFIMNI